MEPQNLLRTVRSAAKKAGLAGVTVHTLRHTCATTALLHGVPLKVVGVSLGHASIKITADIYGHLTDDATRAGAEALSVALECDCDSFSPFPYVAEMTTKPEPDLLSHGSCSPSRYQPYDGLEAGAEWALASRPHRRPRACPRRSLQQFLGEET